MKKFKKLLAGILAGAMMLGSMTTTAFADEGSGATTPPVSTINTSETGSLTINKYEGTGTSKPLPDVEFTIYKIATIEQVTSGGSNPYTEVQFNPVKVLSNINITSATKYDDIKEEVLAQKSNLIKKTGKTVLKNGVATVKFESLDLGVYMVEETDAPSQIVNKTANFLVSIPMAATDKGNTIGWNYDVVANPKNAAVYGGIVLKKKGKTLNCDGSSTESVLSNIKFELQKKETDWNKLGEYTTDENGLINIAELAPGTYRFIECGYADAVSDKGYIIDTTASYEFTVDTNGKVEKAKNERGESVGDINSIETKGSGSNLTYEFAVINEKPKVDKFVMDGDEEKKVKDNQVGDTVTWKVKASIPEKIASLQTYQLVDQLSKGLKVDSENLNMKVKVDNTGLVSNTDYRINIGDYNGTNGTTITVDFTAEGKQKLSQSNTKVVEITFDSILTKDAVIGNAGNPNDVTLKYSNTTDTTSTSEPEETIPNEIPAVFTYALDIYKFCKADGSNTPLAGAEFTVYGSKKDTNNNVVIDEDTIIAAGKSGTDGNVVFTSSEITLPTGNTPNAISVKEGTYYIKETKAPKEYNLLKDTIEVNYTIKYSGSSKLNNRHQTATVSITNSYGTVTDIGHLHYEIENKKGFTLPITGGMGTVIFSVLGIALVLAGLLVISASRKKAAK